ncbi:MAG: ADP-ribose pyrophosphatase (precursor) [Candidatus Tokpelaia hoelldobleri]|uniref:8-oxo-dGTP diphosphatase n=1 Tax=Candidatus Tokpelaia hoelldobleri TaxID=1902579 RepID=A0A1U9JWH1_9HYPH|nr:MAG: ADP-ribose pyrophosphatase (precursor) [Candidatus Tokpelaia hoelldoblerii]
MATIEVEDDKRHSHPLVLVVACALVDGQGRVLLAERPQGKSMAGLWEFPGGKVEAGETPEAALVRELMEELGVAASVGNIEPLTFASHTYERFHLLMPLYFCRRFTGTPRSQEGQRLAWVRLAWVAAENLADYPMPAADIPLLPALRQVLAQEFVDGS